jgi:NitT/TauT family transport system ATP-binding protein
MLSVTGVSKTFERGDTKLTALDNVSLDLGRGKFGTLIGPSGCGKTTLLRIVAGLITPTAGHVYVDGNLSMTPSYEKGFVFQHFNLLPWRTVLGNAEYGLELRGVGAKERRARAREQLKVVGLEHFENHYPSEISGGMRQRVGIARALLIQPKILLMDEPFGALDAMTRELMQEELLAIVERHALSVLFVTHSVDEAVYLSDRIFAMGTRPGRVMRVYDVDLRPRARQEGVSIRALPEFGALRDDIWTLVRKGVEVAA